MAYIGGENKPEDPHDDEQCPFCAGPRRRDEDALIVHRGRTCFVLMNLFPYNSGHMLVCPYRHVSDYTDLTPEEREELSIRYADLAGRSDRRAWEEELRAGARQRLMQALGAYGFLGKTKGKTAFLAHIPVAAERLAELCESDPAWQPLAEPIRAAAR